LQKYIEINKYKCDIRVLVFCSNEKIAIESRKISHTLNFDFFNRNNFGGGEGALLILSKEHSFLIENFDYVVYLEESCEPLNSKWLAKLIHDLETGSLITGWHWNWRAKKRPESTLIRTGSGLRIAHAYVNSDNSLPFRTYKTEQVLDTPSFRHECIAFRPNLLKRLVFSENEIQDWGNLQPKFFGLAMELFAWNGNNESVLKSPNFQYWALLNQRKLPLFIPKNYRFFRELSLSERSEEGTVPYKINYLRNFFINKVFFLYILLKNSIKFLLVGVLRIEILSKYRDDL
jgi:hypothetical protein